MSSRRRNVWSPPVPPPADVAMLPRGVWYAPYVGVEGGAVLLSITSRQQKLAEMTVPAGVSLADAEARLQCQLDAEDPPGDGPRLVED